MYLITLLLRIEIYLFIFIFFPYSTLRENQFVSEQQRGEGVSWSMAGMGVGVECCTLDIKCLLHFSKEMVMPACGACVQIKWRDRKMHY